MDWVIVAVLALGIPIGLAVWLIARAVSTRERLDELSLRLARLEVEISRLQRSPAVPSPEPGMDEGEVGATAAAVPQEALEPKAPLWSQAPPTPPLTVPVAPTPSIPPTLPTARLSPVYEAAPLQPSEAPRESLPKINWEQFMGVKMFAWVGGLALFLGVAFFVKYSFDNNLVSPELRVALGFLAGTGLLIGGVAMSRKNYGALSQTLCATGVVILYAVTFACRAVYHFDFFGPLPTFLLMALITTAAFFLAVRLNPT